MYAKRSAPRSKERGVLFEEMALPLPRRHCLRRALVRKSGVPDEIHSRPEITALLARGVTRMLAEHGLAPVLEVPLANGRRADVMALTARGEIWIVETKSCLADYAVDLKWPDYIDYCDRFFFAVTEGFPLELIPEDVGLIVADGFGGAILRDSPVRPLAGARRKAVTLLFARLAALRLNG